MTQNPFEAPRVYDAPFQRSIPGSPGRFEVGQCFSDAWNAVKQDIGLVIGVTIVGLLVGIAGYVTVLGIFLVLPVLGWGGVKFLLNLQDGRAEFADLFSGFKQYGAALGGMLLLGLLMIVPMIPAYAVMGAGVALESTALMGVGQLLSFAIAFGVMLRLYFAVFFMVDQGLGAIDAMKASWEATNDQKLATLGLALLAGAVALAGYLACIVGIFVSMPMSYLMFASAYRQMVGDPQR